AGRRRAPRAGPAALPQALTVAPPGRQGPRLIAHSAVPATPRRGSDMNVPASRIARTLALAALASAVAVGCSKKVKETPPAETPVDTGSTAPVTDAAPGAYTPADLDTDACLRQRVVYFDLDQDALKPEFQAAMACHAKYLRD